MRGYAKARLATAGALITAAVTVAAAQGAGAVPGDRVQAPPESGDYIVTLASGAGDVAAIAEGTPWAYEAEWRRLGRRHVALTSGLLALSRPPVTRRRIVPLAARFPAVFRAAVDELARPA